MMNIDVLHAQIVRSNTALPWGLHLHGGGGQPLIIVQIAAGSPASKIGIQSGDRVTHVQGKSINKMTSSDVTALVNQQGCTLLLTVERPVQDDAHIEPSQQPQIPRGLSISTMVPPTQQLYKPRPPLYYTPPVKTQPRSTVVTSLGDLSGYSSQHLEDGYTNINSQEILSEIPPFASNNTQHNEQNQFEYQTVRAQPFTRSGRLTPRQRPGTAESRSSSEAEMPASVPSPLSFSSPSYSPAPTAYSNYSTPPSSSNVTTSQPQCSDVNSDLYDDRQAQSRTFRMLQSLMFNEVPSSGDQALPPPRSASQEQRREEEAERRAGLVGVGGGAQRQRMRVFMPQQYNSPLSMYSAPNIINTFQDQAEKYFESLERKNRHQQPEMYVEKQGFYDY